MLPFLLLIIFFIFYFGEYLFSTSLTILNISSSLKNKDNVPAFIKDFIDKKKYSKSVNYSLRKEKFSLATSSVSMAITFAVIISQFPALVNQWIAIFSFHPYIHGIVYILILTALSSVLSLPFSLYSQFVIEEEFGFNKMSGKTFAKDLLKSSLLSVILFVPLLAVLFLFIDKSGSFWWLYAFLFFAGFQLVITLLYPLVIAPLFNKFTELEDGPLKMKLYGLAEKTSFKAKGIFIMDGSKRSSHSNAYFTGFGRSRRIVLFDTLISTLSEDEIEGVLAHEIGHFKKKHILKNLVSSLFMSFLFFFILSLLYDYMPLFKAFGFVKPSFHALLVILSFCMGPFTFFLKPIFTMKSRKNEYEADKYACEIVNSSEPLVNALITLGKENLSNLTPHPLYSFFHYSHPVLSERIKAMEEEGSKENGDRKNNLSASSETGRK